MKVCFWEKILLFHILKNTEQNLIIFSLMNIDTQEVLKAASTKWNFLNFKPGLVGGHCIGVDPYYLIHKSQQVGIIPDLLMSVRKINDGMSIYFSQRILTYSIRYQLIIFKS